jgi:hypothetical protein
MHVTVRPAKRHGTPRRLWGLLVITLLGVAGFFSAPLFPPLRQYREAGIQVMQAEVAHLPPPPTVVLGAQNADITPVSGPRVSYYYGNGIQTSQAVLDYYATAAPAAGWHVQRATWLDSVSDLIATYRKQAQGYDLKMVIDCGAPANSHYTLTVVIPDIWNGQSGPSI